MKEKYLKNWIKPGMKVAHLDSPKKRMTVSQIIREEIKIGGKSRTVVSGVECSWFDVLPDKSSKHNFFKFHTHDLVPWEIAELGPEAISNFINRFSND